MLSIDDQDHDYLKNLSGKKFLITGGNGMLGNSFLNQLKINISSPKIYCLNRSELNVSNFNSFTINKALSMFLINKLP